MDAGTGGSIAAGTYYAVVTYLNAAGETVGSPVSAGIVITANHKLTVNSPVAQTGATNWQAYVSQAGGNTGPFILQGGSTLIGTNQTFSTLAVTGATPPVTNTAYTNSYLRVGHCRGCASSFQVSVFPALRRVFRNS